MSALDCNFHNFDDRKIMKIYCLLFILFVLGLSAAAQKNDTVFLLNGDKITGEFKRYDLGILNLSTDAMGTVDIEFDKISTVHSMKFFKIMDKSGFDYFGSLCPVGKPGYVGIVVTNDTIEKPFNELVQMFPIKSIFWKKFSGSLDLGASYYLSTQTFQYNVSAALSYRAKKDLLDFGLASIYSNQVVEDSNEISKKNDIGLDYTHYFKGRWWGSLGTKAQQNSELNLQYRIQGGLAAGYDIVHTNKVRFFVKGGALFNREEPLDSSYLENSIEAIVGMKCLWFQYKHPQINLTTDMNVYPSLTISQRIRVEYAIAAKYEVFNNFYFGLTFYDNFDNKPAGGGPKLNDWGWALSIGYSFN
jgi:hypothetical protein